MNLSIFLVLMMKLKDEEMGIEENQKMGGVKFE